MLFKTFHEEKTLAQIVLHFCSQVDELRQKLEQKNKLIEKKTQEALLVCPFHSFFHFHFLLLSPPLFTSTFTFFLSVPLTFSFPSLSLYFLLVSPFHILFHFLLVSSPLLSLSLSRYIGQLLSHSLSLSLGQSIFTFSSTFTWSVHFTFTFYWPAPLHFLVNFHFLLVSPPSLSSLLKSHFHSPGQSLSLSSVLNLIVSLSWSVPHHFLHSFNLSFSVDPREEPCLF